MKQKNIFTLLQRVMLLFVLIIPLVYSHGQEKVLAKYDSKSDTSRGLLGLGGPAVIDESNLNSDNDNVATLYASPGVAHVISQYDSHIIAKFDEVIPENQWSYVQLDGDKGLFDVLLGGNLGTALGEVLGIVLLGKQNIVVSALTDGNTEVFNTSSNDKFSGSQSRLFIDSNGKTILAIKPNKAYQKIKIENKAISLIGLLNEFKTEVAKVFTYNDSVELECGKPIGTSFDGSEGLDLTVLGFNSDNKNFAYAIDGNDDTFSVLGAPGLLKVNLGTSFSQYFYYPNVSEADASFNVTLGLGVTGVLNLDLLGGIEVNAYNGSTKVYSKSLASGLINGIDILGLLQSNGKATVVFAPGKGFDRIEVKANGGINVSLLKEGLRIYDVERYGGEGSGCENPLINKPDGDNYSLFLNPACATELINSENVDFASWAVDGNNKSAATLFAANGKLLGLIGNKDVNGMIHMTWEDEIPANTPTYIRIDTNERLLTSLLGSILGGIGDNLGSVLVGNYYFQVDAYHNDRSVLSRKSSNGFNGGNDAAQGSVSIVQDKQGYYYLKVVPTVDYHSVKITNSVNPGLLNISADEGVFTMDVYDMCREINTVESLCGSPISTSLISTGLNIDLLGGSTDNHFERAIDGNETSFSVLPQGGLLNVSVLGSVAQSFDFATPSKPNATFSITMQMAKGITDINLLGGIEVIAYNGLKEVYRKPITSGLIANLDVLNLISKGDKVTLRFGPGRSFDRVEFRVNQGAELNLLGQGIQIYEVKRFGSACPDPAIEIPLPTEKPFEEAVCSGELIDFKNVDFPFNAVDGNNESYASLVSSNGSILNLGATTSMIQMSTGGTLPANKTSYIRINAEKDVLDALLSGTVGKLVSGVGEALLGNHIITVEAYNDTTQVLEAVSADGFIGNAKGKVTLVQDTKGRYYLAVTPTSSYNNVKISTQSSALLGTGGVKVLDVYDMCYEAGLDSCFPVQFTAWDQRGLTLGLGGGTGVLQGAGVTNAFYAIDANSSSYSQITAGTLGVGASVYQAFYFTQPSLVGDELKVRLQAGNSGVLNATVLGSYKVVTYLGDAMVQEFTLQQGLIHELDLLALFKAGGIQTFTFNTTGIYDRVEIVANGLVNVSTSADLKIYEVKRVGVNCPEVIVPHPFEDPVCASILMDAHNADDIQNVFDDNFDSFATIQSGAGFLLGIGEKEGIIELGYDHIVKGGTTSYVRFDIDEGLLGDLLSGSLGGLVSDLVNTILLGNHYFTVEVKNENGVVILDGNSSETNSQTLDGIIRVMIDREGRTYLAITPKDDYKSVRITDKTKAIVNVTTPLNSMNIYSMCYEASGNTCQDVFATSYEYSGLSLTVEGVTNFGVVNPERAIDDNSTHYSELSAGTIGVDSKVTQWFYFNTPSKAGEVVNIDFSTSQGTVKLDLLGKIEIIAYKGDTQIEKVDFSNGLVNGINVLNLIQNGGRVALPFAPNGEYDRIAISLKNLLGVELAGSLRIYNVSRTCQVLSERFTSWKTYTVGENKDASITSVKGGELVNYTIHVRNDGTSNIGNFFIQDVLQEEFEDVDVSDFGTYDPTTRTVTFANDGALAPNQVQSFSFSARVKLDLDKVTQIVNIARVTTTSNTVGSLSFPPLDNTVNPSEPDTSKEPGTIILVDPTDSILISKTGVSSNANSNAAALGDVLTYTITITNKSNKAIRNFTVVDTIENSADVTVEILDSGDGVVNGDQITFRVPILNVGETKTITLKTKITKVPDNNVVGEITNIATVNYTSPIDQTLKSVSDDFIFSTSCSDITAGAITVSKIPEICGGIEQTITASVNGANYLNPVFRWYSDENLSNLVHEGASFSITPFDNTTYYVTVQATGFCFVGDPKMVEVVLKPGTAKPTLRADMLAICAGSSATLTSSQGDKYYWYLDGVQLSGYNDRDQGGTDLGYSTQKTIETTFPGEYTVRVETSTLCVSAESNKVTITELPTPVITIAGRQNIFTNVGETVTLPSASIDAGGTIKWFKVDENGDFVSFDPTQDLKFTDRGTYTYYIEGSLGDCKVYETIIVTVFDPGFCEPLSMRKWATDSESWGGTFIGWVNNRGNAKDGDPATHSTITTLIGLLGLGTTWQNVYFDEEIPAGTPVTVKLGKEYSAVGVASGISVQGLKYNGKTIGGLKAVDGGIVDLLIADNVIEYTFVPMENGKPVPYQGVRIVQGALLSVAQNTKVYGAHVPVAYDANGYCGSVSNVVVARSNVADVLHGVKDLKLGVATSLASVVNPWNAVDNDLDSYALINRAVSLLNAATLTVVFKQPATPTDELQILLENPGNAILSLDLIKGYQIQRYLGDTKVGPVLDAKSDFLSLKLLGLLGGYKDKSKVIIAPTGEPYDRVEFTFASVASVFGEATKIYDVSLVPTFEGGNDGVGTPLEVCEGGILHLENKDGCTFYNVYLNEVGGDALVPSDNSNLYFNIGDLAVGEHILWVQSIRNGCEIGPRVPLKVQVNASPEFSHYLFNNNELVENDDNKLAIKVHRGDKRSTLVAFQDPVLNDVTWEMEVEDPNVQGGTMWIAVPFATVDKEGKLTIDIPKNGRIDGVDYSGKKVNIRGVLWSKVSNGPNNPGPTLSCATYGDIIEVEIAKRSNVKSNLNVTQRIK